MVDIKHSSWAERDADNNSPSPNGIQPGYAPSTVGPILQATKAAVKRSFNQINAIYTTTGTAAALVLTYAVAPAPLVKGERYAFFASQTNTGAMTLNVNGLGAKAILQQDGAALEAGQIVAGSATTVIYDGTAFRLENYVSNPKFTGTLSVDAITATTITATNLTGTLSGNGATITGLNASQLTSGTLPNARISGAYDGITTLAQTGMHTISTGGEAVRIASPNDTSDPYLTFYKTIDASQVRQGYVQHADGTTVGTSGLMLVNDVSGMRLVIDNTAGTNGLTHRVGSTNYNVWTTGNLPTPAVQATQIIAGTGLTGGGSIAANRTITLGTPATVTNTTGNTVTETGHTHALTLVAGDITGTLGYTPANISSPAFTGTPTAPTQGVGDNSTRLATTAFVSTAVGNGVANVMPTIAAQGAGGVGTYAFLMYGPAVGPGTQIAGTSLSWASAYSNNGGNVGYGMWRLMGYSSSGDNGRNSSLWLRYQ